MQSWTKRGKCRNFREYVVESTGTTAADICASGEKNYICPGIPEAAKMLRDAVEQNRPIRAVVDYDADGIDSGAEIYLILKRLGAKDIRILVPKRKKDGYGINPHMIDGMPDEAFVITIDNGIAAAEAVRRAKARGMTVLVLDHHQQNGELPMADLIVDPEAFPKGWTFTKYCGAGLAYKLAQHMFQEDTSLLSKLSCFAAIATIGDSVNVTGDNRNIVIEGLKNLNAHNCTEGLSAVLHVLEEKDGIKHFQDYELGYKLAPMINAPGRLSDEGGVFVLSALFATGSDAAQKAEKLYEINEHRKELVTEALETLEPIGNNIAFLYKEGIEEGLCGIIAGRLSESLNRPAFVMTKSESGLIKGSARSEGETNVLLLLQKAGQYMTKFGGHKPAAGFSFEEKYLEDVFDTLEGAALPPDEEAANFYDFEADVRELPYIYEEMRQIEVFGQGLERPVIKVRTPIDKAKVIGKDETHLSFLMHKIKAVGFSLKEKYEALGSPDKAIVYGRLTINWWNGPNMQFQADDIEEI